MKSRSRRGRTLTAAVIGVSVATMAAVVTSATAGAQTSSGGARLVAIPGSLAPTTDRVTGAFRSARMSVEVALSPRNPAALRAELAGTYTKKSAEYHHWLARGRFDARFAPYASVRLSVDKYLRADGLRVESSASPFLVRAVGSSSRIATAFHTTLSNFEDSKGITYFANSTVVKLPEAIAPHVLGVIGLSDTVRDHTYLQREQNLNLPAYAEHNHGNTNPACETPYVTVAQLYNAVDNGIGFPYGYGDGPGCSGLTPSQTNGLYGAPKGNDARAQGRGATAAVFELSAYQTSDIQTWEHYFYGNGYNANIQNVNVDGGPLAPICPAGDECPADYNDYSGDIEVDADIQMELDVAPDVSRLLVYEAPNDFTGQTELDNYGAIASQDVAETVSSSWGLCENDAGAGYVEAENVIFEQMALQGQSVFNSSGDTGAFGCIRSDGTTIANVGDPASQPWVTSVGGTSFGNDNPGGNENPSYPSAGTETVWNVDNLCNTSADEGEVSGYFWCAVTGAGGGGSSQFWGRPFYQFGPGVNNAYDTTGNGTTQCSLANTGTPCRQVPDVSANADAYTGYAEYCTANAGTPYSSCGFSSGEPVSGWFQIGGTSLSTPLWAALITDRDAYQGFRTGNINPLVYLAGALAPSLFFHDINGIGQTTNNNGLFPVTPGFDEATGVGSPRFDSIITGF